MTVLIIAGLIMDIIGVCILMMVIFFGVHGHKIYDEKWSRKYWWNGWRPIYRSTKTGKYVLYWKRRPIVYGAISPHNLWNGVGFLFILFGFILQMLSYL